MSGAAPYTDEIESGLGSIYPMPGGLKENVYWLLGEDALVVATGGMALMVAEESKVIDKLDGLLTLKGLRLIYERNRTEVEK